MTLTEEFKQIEMSPRKYREFGLLVGGVLLALGAFLIWRGRAGIPFVSAGAVLMVLGVLVPVLLKHLYRLWMGLALVLGWAVSRVLLSVLFYAVVTPIALIARLTGKKFLELEFPGAKQETYWYRRPGKDQPADCEKQF